MKFTKMQGCGNDYIYVNGFEEPVEHASEMAKRLSDRHFGIGADGLILIGPSQRADFSMSMYNADGSEGAMCGNGIRCLGKYVYEKGLTDQTRITVETGAGIRTLHLNVRRGAVDTVRVDMGSPRLCAREVPAVSVPGIEIDPQKPVMNRWIKALGQEYQVTCVSMGNPHAVVFLKDEEEACLDLEKAGPALECHPMFPDRANVEFIRCLDDAHIRMRVWERGSGETLACGTGACAAVVAGALTGRTKEAVLVELAGGQLEIFYDRAKDIVWMEGPAVAVFEGEL